MAVLLKYSDSAWFADGRTTPLHLAAMNGHTGVVELIIRNNGDGHDWRKERMEDPAAIQKINTTLGWRFSKQLEGWYGRKTFSAREIAAIYGHDQTALAFPSSSDDDIFHAISCACMLGDAHTVETLWRHHESRSWWATHSDPRKQVRQFPAPPLHLAVMSGDRATVAFLLERGLAADGQSSSSSSDALRPYSAPAHYAAIVGLTKLLQTLERRQADLTALDFMGRTPLSYAIENLHEEVVELLVTRKPLGRAATRAKSANLAYLGPGHVWKDLKSQPPEDVYGSRIMEALGRVGITTA